MELIYQMHVRGVNARGVRCDLGDRRQERDASHGSLAVLFTAP
jgi:hypothetical protein